MDQVITATEAQKTADALQIKEDRKMKTAAPIRLYLKPPNEYFKNPKSLALLQAALSGDLAGAKQLAANGADPNEEGPMENANASRLRPLHYAIGSKNLEAVRILLTVGADAEMVAQHNGDALTFAVNYGDIKVLTLLLDWRPIKTLTNKTLKYMAFNAIRDGRRDCLDLLLQRGLPVDFRDGAEYTMLMAALNVVDLDLALYLLGLGASVNIDTPSGVTPAYSVQYMLPRYKPGSEAHQKLEQIQRLMVERGATFPATDPRILRERRKAPKASGG